MAMLAFDASAIDKGRTRGAKESFERSEIRIVLSQRQDSEGVIRLHREPQKAEGLFGLFGFVREQGVMKPFILFDNNGCCNRV